MERLKLWKVEEINQEDEVSPYVKVYESTTGPYVSLVTKEGPGLRLDRPQVIELRDWFTNWLIQHDLVT